MRDYAEQRLKELREEFEIGQKQLTALETRMADLKGTLFRISGAIQVLEDVLSHYPRASDSASENGGRAPQNSAPSEN